MEDGGRMRIRSKLAEYPSKEAQKKTMEDTLGTLLGFGDLSRQAVANMESVQKMLSEKKFELSHFTRRDDLGTNQN